MQSIEVCHSGSANNNFLERIISINISFKILSISFQISIPDKAFNMSLSKVARMSNVSLGLFVSSHVQNYPLHLFKDLDLNIDFRIHPIHISSKPKNIYSILKQGTARKIIKYIKSNNIHLDYILILIGVSDVGHLTVPLHV